MFLRRFNDCLLKWKGQTTIPSNQTLETGKTSLSRRQDVDDVVRAIDQTGVYFNIYDSAMARFNDQTMSDNLQLHRNPQLLRYHHCYKMKSDSNKTLQMFLLNNSFGARLQGKRR